MGNIPEAMVAVSRIEDIFLSIQIIGQDPLQYIDEFFSRMGRLKYILVARSRKKDDHHGIHFTFFRTGRKVLIDIIA